MNSIYEAPTTQEAWNCEHLGYPLPKRLTHEAQQAIADGSLVSVNGQWVRARSDADVGDGLIQTVVKGPYGREIYEFRLAEGETHKRWLDHFKAPGRVVVRFWKTGENDSVAERLKAERLWRETGFAYPGKKYGD